MIGFKTEGKIGKFRYSVIGEELSLSIINEGTAAAYMSALLNVPVDMSPDRVDPVLKNDLEFELATDEDPIGKVWVKSPYANIAEKGSRHRLAHPFMRPASQAAKLKMKSVLRKKIRLYVDKEKIREKSSSSQ